MGTFSDVSQKWHASFASGVTDILACVLLVGAKKSQKVTLLFLAITDLICVLISGDSAVTIFEERCVPNRESMSVCHVLVVQKLSSRHFLVRDEHLYFDQFEFSRLIFTVKFTNPKIVLV